MGGIARSIGIKILVHLISVVVDGIDHAKHYDVVIIIGPFPSAVPVRAWYQRQLVSPSRSNGLDRSVRAAKPCVRGLLVRLIHQAEDDVALVPDPSCYSGPASRKFVAGAGVLTNQRSRARS